MFADPTQLLQDLCGAETQLLIRHQPSRAAQLRVTLFGAKAGVQVRWRGTPFAQDAKSKNQLTHFRFR